MLITDSGKQFDAKSFKEFCSELGIEQHFVSVAHPQLNGLAEVTNRTIIQGLRKRLNGAKANWVEELASAL